MRRGHGLAERGDRLDGGICAGERRVEKGAGRGEEASGATEGSHCGRGSEWFRPVNGSDQRCVGHSIGIGTQWVGSVNNESV